MGSCWALVVDDGRDQTSSSAELVSLEGGVGGSRARSPYTSVRGVGDSGRRG